MEEVYENNYYGTMKMRFKNLEKTKSCAFDVDVIGGINLKKHFNDKALSIFIIPHQ